MQRPTAPKRHFHSLSSWRIFLLALSFTLIAACGDDAGTGSSGQASDTLGDSTLEDTTPAQDTSTPDTAGCTDDSDCESGVCEAVTGTCLEPTCLDGVNNGDESGTDCGGSCDPCGDGEACQEPADCVGGICDGANMCASPSCSDGMQNADESGVDCGGSDCPLCGSGSGCVTGEDCVSEVCAEDLTCAPALCDDGVQNGDENGVDCGNGCDIGCPPGTVCTDDEICDSGICGDSGGTCTVSVCNDQVENGEETGLDCGGPNCSPCGLGVGCAAEIDCLSGVCDELGGVCVLMTCGDGSQNGTETDLDCGGPDCGVCGDGEVCVVDEDCASGACDDISLLCLSNECNDGAVSGTETGVDCGGPDCPTCGTGEVCVTNEDCASGACAGGLCEGSECGDGVTNTSEACDDGGESPTCTVDCTLSSCGDGITNVSAGEACDLGALNSDVAPDTCRTDCTLPACGDGVRDTDEACDDGNTDSNDGCLADCSAAETGFTCTDDIPNVCISEECGDGVVNAGEECDDSGESGVCDVDCTFVSCGDGVMNAAAGEACDGGGESSACNTNCTLASCGDGTLNAAAGEACDDGGSSPGDGCDSACSLEVGWDCSGEPSICGATGCGDGITADTETCDDGGIVPDDGCDATCNLESGWSCTGNPSVCESTGCGDGVIAGSEACDDSGESSTCNIDCTTASCGDGTINISASETCDDGDLDDTNACLSSCEAASCGDGFVYAGFEECDASGESSACNADCTFTSCGDGITNASAGEECDTTGESSTCDLDCTTVSCGDGLTNFSAGEICDTTGESSSCNANCTPASCGDGITNASAGEDCDTTGESSTCDADCTTASCGDGVVNGSAGEVCDDGNTSDSDFCLSTCQIASCVDGIVNANETDVDCGGSDCAPCVADDDCLLDSDCETGLTCDANVCAHPTSCLELMLSDPSAVDGVYTIDPDGVGTISAFDVQCDMSTDGGGWTLALNYLHQGGTNPNTLVLSDRLPVLGSALLGDDESASTTTWGHAGNALMSVLNFGETRWYAKTGLHSRVIDFKTNAPSVKIALETGGGCVKTDLYDPAFTTNLPLRNNSTLPLHTSGENNGYCDQGDDTMTNFPFYSDSGIGNPRAHWGIQGLSNRWEADDYPLDQGSSESGENTHHQVWGRAFDPCNDGVQNGAESDIDCGGICATGCDSGAGCSTGSDCISGSCTAGVCDSAVSCAAIIAQNPSAASGDYTINTGIGGPVTVYCDMDSDGGVGHTMYRIDDGTLGAEQQPYRDACAAVGMELIVPRTRGHAYAIRDWNGEIPNLVGVYPMSDSAQGLENWEGECNGVRGCRFWLSDSRSTDCSGVLEPNGDNNTGDAIYLIDGAICDYGHWNDQNNVMATTGWVLCSTNDAEPETPRECTHARDSDNVFNTVETGGITGVYTIDPEEDGTTFDVHCDQDTDGGGWTLAIKADGAQTTFSYDQAIWESSTLLNEASPNLDTTEAKLETFNSVAVSQVMVAMDEGDGYAYQTLDLSSTSLFDLFNGAAYQASSIGRTNWKSLITDSSLQSNCNMEGANVDPSGNASHSRARLGVISNQENDCNTPDSRIGIGTQGNACGQLDSLSVGNSARCSSDNGDKDITAFGAVYVRTLAP